MSLDFLLAWMMIFLRSLGVILQLPVLTSHPIPITVRLGICVCLATLLTGLVPAAPVPLGLWELIGAVTGEVVLGLALGFVARMAFSAIEMAGRLMASQIGLSATPGMGVPDPSTEPLAALLSTFAVVMFFLLGAHHGVLTAFARSFQLAPAGRAAFDSGASLALIRGTSRVIELGLRIAAPFIAMNFLITLAFSVLGRSVTKMNVFVLSFAANSFVGLALLSAAGSLVARYLYIEFGAAPLRMLELLPPR